MSEKTRSGSPGCGGGMGHGQRHDLSRPDMTSRGGLRGQGAPCPEEHAPRRASRGPRPGPRARDGGVLGILSVLGIPSVLGVLGVLGLLGIQAMRAILVMPGMPGKACGGGPCGGVPCLAAPLPWRQGKIRLSGIPGKAKRLPGATREPFRLKFLSEEG